MLLLKGGMITLNDKCWKLRVTPRGNHYCEKSLPDPGKVYLSLIQGDNWIW